MALDTTYLLVGIPLRAKGEGAGRAERDLRCEVRWDLCEADREGIKGLRCGHRSKEVSARLAEYSTQSHLSEEPHVSRSRPSRHTQSLVEISSWGVCLVQSRAPERHNFLSTTKTS